ncbi:hypothetical protein [Aquibium sp. ELW1220]|jgi:hypothetical protein|uniref:hypothetical protein n=1 Tax=Aquibium sp. ELW1220 TaxID=2976766 RepID=UPI0025B200D4|nr:hypothetical protein [Aquibium sp. ELW1220]MDN2579690.1 hypothetical protein [Aquibium sp. ELW1220]
MTKLREQIPYSAYEAARAACEAMKAGRPLNELDFFERLEIFRREPQVDRDDDVVVMTIN